MSVNINPFPNDFKNVSTEFFTTIATNLDFTCSTSSGYPNWKWGDGNITTSDLSPSHSYSIPGTYNVDMYGLDASEFTSLYLFDNGITDINFNGFINLSHVVVRNNALSTLDVNMLDDLVLLELQFNSISILDLTNNTSLRNLDASANSISNIDITNNIHLEYVNVSNNLLNVLNTSTLVDLENLDVSNNSSISILDLSTNTSLETLNVSDTNISSLDITSNVNLKEVIARNLPLPSLDPSVNTSLEILDVGNNNLNSLDISNITTLEELYIDNNNINAPNLTEILEQLDLSGVLNGTFDYSNNTVPSVNGIPFYDNLVSKGWNLIGPMPTAGNAFTTNAPASITTLVETSDTSLANWDWDDGSQTINDNNPTYTYTDGIPLHGVDIYNTDLTKITRFEANGAGVIDFFTSNFPNLVELSLRDNLSLSNIDLTPLTVLDRLSISGSNTGNIDISNNTNLRTINAVGSGITDIDLTNNPLMQTLFLGQNNISNIDLTNLPNLAVFGFNSNNLSSIDFSNNPLLRSIGMKTQPNSLTEMDISNNPLLELVDIGNSNLSESSVNHLLTTLDLFGLSNGYLDYENNTNPPTGSAAYISYHNLLSKGWTIVGVEPIVEINGNFRTTTQSDVSPLIMTFDASLASWDWGDGNFTFGNNNPTYIYTDNLPFHDFSLLGVNPIQVRDIFIPNDEITEADVSNFTNLQLLYLDGNDLSALDLTNNTSLVGIRLQGNNISVLGLPNTSTLTDLDIPFNPIGDIDLSNLTGLENIRINATGRTTIDLTPFPNLDDLRIHFNTISSIDITNNPLLTYIEMRNNNIGSVDIDKILVDLDNFGLSNGTFSYLNNPGESNLTAITAYNNLVAKGWNLIGQAPVTILEDVFRTESQGTISPTIATSDSSLVSWVWGDGNTTSDNNAPSHTYNPPFDPFYDIDMIEVDPLTVTSISFQWDELVLIDVSSFINLTFLGIWRNELTSINIDNLTLLEYFNVGNNNLTDIDISNNVLMNICHCDNNALSELDVTNNTLLETLRCQNNTITELDVTNNTLLEQLWCHENSISLLDVSNLINLTYLICRDNNLNSEQIDQILIDLDSHGNINGTLDYSNNPGETSLTAITAYSNLLSKGWNIIGASPFPILEDIFRTTSQGTITPAVAFDFPSTGQNASWDWGDGSQTLNLDNPSHTYTDAQPFHDVDIFGIDPLEVSRINFENDELLSFDITPFVNVKELRLSFNNMSIFDLSNQVQLEQLFISNNNLTNIILPPSIQPLTVIRIDNNNITGSLSAVSNYQDLNQLWIQNNNYTDLDVVNNPSLLHLICQNNQFNSAVIDKILIDLDGHGQINGSLNYQGNPGESSLTAYNAYQSLIAKGWNITGQVPHMQLSLFTTTSQGTISPSITTTSGITDWNWGDGNYTLDNNTPTHTYTDALPEHDVTLYGIDPLNVTEINLINESISSFDVSDFTNITKLSVSNNPLNNVDVSAYTSLEWLQIWDANLTTLDVGNLVNLTILQFQVNGISSIDLSNNTDIQIIYCQNNLLTNLDIINLSSISIIRAMNNNISNFDISNNPSIIELRLSDNNLDSQNIDDIIIQLDNNGLSNGFLYYDNNPGESSITALTPYNNLISKGWTIIGAVPTNAHLLQNATLNTLENDYLSNANRNLGTNWSVAGWVEFNSQDPNSWCYLLSTDTTSSSIDYIRINANGTGSTVTSYIGFVGDATSTTWNADTNLHHWAFNKIGNVLDVYLDGNLIGTNTVGDANWFANHILGKQGGFSDGFFDGNIYQYIQIADGNLSPTSISFLASAGKPICSGDWPQSVIDEFIYTGNFHYSSMWPMGNFNGNNVGTEFAPLFNSASVSTWTNNGATIEDNSHDIICDEPVVVFAWSAVTDSFEENPIAISGFQIGDKINWGDGNVTIYNTGTDGNHTYIDGLQYHEITVYSADPSLQIGLSIDNDGVTDVGVNNIDISNLTGLTTLTVKDSLVENLTLPSTLLDDVDLSQGIYTSDTLDQVIIDLDNNGLINGTLNYIFNVNSPSSNAYDAYQSLLSKGWSITGTAPTPQLYEGLQALYQVDTGVTLDGNKVDAWADTSGNNAGTLTIVSPGSSGDRRPNFNNGRVEFVDGHRLGSMPIQSGDFTYVFRDAFFRTSSGNAGKMFMFRTTASSGDTAYANNTSGQDRIQIRSNDNTAYFSNVFNTEAPDLTLMIEKSGNTLTFYNGTSAIGSHNVTGKTFQIPNLGSTQSFIASSTVDFSIGKFIAVYDRMLTPTEKQDILTETWD